MREIKFKVWNKTRNGFFGTASVEIRDGVLACNDNEVIILSTGLKDKNGKEIYEGDIVCTEYNPGNHENCHKQFHDVVEYKDGAYSTFNPANGYEYGSDPNECEVLGNIYENTELVQSK